MADFRYKSLKTMKNRQYRFDTAIQFIDFHRFPLSIDKNHLIATDFYRLTTPEYALIIWEKSNGEFP